VINIIKAVKEEEPILHNIMQFYIYEFSQYIPAIALEADGRYQPFDFTPYWDNSNHHAFLIRKENELIGFALVESSSDKDPNSILEFFIIRKYSGQGYGKIAAHKIFSIFPGKWHITQIEKNEPAKAFWRNTISSFTSGNYSERIDERKMTIQEFDTTMYV
jgi:predicted acetyltransferase